jgi:predicted Zn-dependent peptidase
MNKIYSLIVVVLLLSGCSKKTTEMVQSIKPVDQSWRGSMPEAATARPISIGDYQSFELKNGLNVIVVENHKLPRISYQISLKNDPIIENDKAGFVSMAGSLISTGTHKSSKSELDAAIDYIGANINSSSNGMFGSSLVKHQDKLLNILTEMLYDASFPEDEFDKLKKQTLSGISTTKTDPNAIAGNVASVINYGKDHPYGEVETEKTIDNISLEDCKKYYNTYFRPNNAYLIIVGDITIDEAKSKAETYFSSWERGGVSNDTYATPEPPSSTNVHFANKDGAVQSVIRVTYPVQLKPGSDDVIKTQVLNTILGGGVFAGRLMQNLREDKAYTYGARSSLSSDALIGTFNASASVRNEVTDSSIVQFLYEMERLIKEPVAEEDLQLAKNSIAGSFARSLESPQTIASFARNTFRYNLPSDYYNTYLNKLDLVSIADITMTAKKYIKPNSANILVVGNKDEVAEKLLPFDADGEIDYYGPFGNKIKYDEIELDGSITAETVISDYIEAIGGSNVLNAVNTLKIEMSGSLMGQTAMMEMNQMKPDKFNMSVKMQGMVLQEQKYDGSKAVTSQMGQKQVFTEGEQYEAIKSEAKMFPQMLYSADQVELVGIDDVDGKKAYKIIVTDSNGKKTTEFYDVSTSLLIRTTSSQAGPGGQEISVINDFAEYKEVGGVLFPHKITISGAMPQPLVMEVSGYTVNGPMPETLFSE